LGREIEVLGIGDEGTPAVGSTDPYILEWIEQNNYILVTENRSSLPKHVAEHFSSGRHVPGLFWIRPDVGIGRVTEELYLVWLASTAEEYRDRTLFIPL
jgi:hypothetical protein